MYDYQALPYEAGRVVAFEREGKCMFTESSLQGSQLTRLLTVHLRSKHRLETFFMVEIRAMAH